MSVTFHIEGAFVQHMTPPAKQQTTTSSPSSPSSQVREQGVLEFVFESICNSVFGMPLAGNCGYTSRKFIVSLLFLMLQDRYNKGNILGYKALSTTNKKYQIPYHSLIPSKLGPNPYIINICTNSFI